MSNKKEIKEIYSMTLRDNKGNVLLSITDLPYLNNIYIGMKVRPKNSILETDNGYMHFLCDEYTVYNTGDNLIYLEGNDSFKSRVVVSYGVLRDKFDY